MSIPSPEKICMLNFDYDYNPDFLYNEKKAIFCGGLNGTELHRF